MESHARSIAKAVTYRVLGFGVTLGVAYLVTHNSSVAAQIGIADTILKIFAYYAHERMWTQLHFGRPKTPDYEI
jgi:uncharacterized membrane protein